MSRAEQRALRRSAEAKAIMAEIAGRRRGIPLELGEVLAGLSGAERERAAAEAGLNRRSAYYLASIHKAVHAGLMDRDDVGRLGWTRARVLAQETLGSGKKVTAARLKAALEQPARLVAAARSGKSPSSVLMDFIMSPGQAAAVRKALSAFDASRGAGPAMRSKALVAICQVALRHAAERFAKPKAAQKTRPR